METVESYAQTAMETLFGPGDKLLYSLMILVVLDYITGICVAIHEKKISSKVGFDGISKKVVIFVMVSLSHVMSEYIEPETCSLCTITTAFYAINECLSIFENAGMMGIPIPDKLKKAMQYFKELKK